ncbi:hypothetical protein BDK51DRAFT_32097 [Blyttiomyces helicus]|uniref:Uncharacterized protein n=1 Tax=Blyttiomyces helicus TaxID=388810 RepID=A0A4P9WC93_9FUNG|nr:hypothetical protein BDK51DRAFT_32097 [Blyttiomyces helicus]|eukprot:RKO90271.1 hypothetical protein BDK51DRAFT_32097 [Blyttiomyces helicus]
MTYTGKQAKQMTDKVRTQCDEATLELLSLALLVKQQQEGHGVLRLGTLRDNCYRKMEYLVIRGLESSTLEWRQKVIPYSWKALWELMEEKQKQNSPNSSFHYQGDQRNQEQETNDWGKREQQRVGAREGLQMMGGGCRCGEDGGGWREDGVQTGKLCGAFQNTGLACLWFQAGFGHVSSIKVS